MEAIDRFPQTGLDQDEPDSRGDFMKPSSDNLILFFGMDQDFKIN